VLFLLQNFSFYPYPTPLFLVLKNRLHQEADIRGTTLVTFLQVTFSYIVTTVQVCLKAQS